ncbi:MAG: hypothetical protein ACOYLQ_12615 [Hyphomicrobiaceae bacterium]
MEKATRKQIEAATFAARPIRPLQSLATVRDAVLSPNPERLPIWRFRLASDLAVELQPQRGPILFKGRAIEASAVSEIHFL